MNHYVAVNILDMLNAIGEDAVKNILSDFLCPKNLEIESFAKQNALEFAKRKMSITYLVIDEEGQLAAIFALILAAVQREIGGMVYLECEDRPKLLAFYENEQNRFRVFGERYSDKDQVKYIQLLRLF